MIFPSSKNPRRSLSKQQNAVFHDIHKNQPLERRLIRFAECCVILSSSIQLQNAKLLYRKMTYFYRKHISAFTSFFYPPFKRPKKLQTDKNHFNITQEAPKSYNFSGLSPLSFAMISRFFLPSKLCAIGAQFSLLSLPAFLRIASIFILYDSDR